MARSALFKNRQSAGLFSIEDTSRSTGTRLYVHSGTGTDSATRGLSPDDPLATIDYAIGLCTANEDDIIYVMPGHAENAAAADAFDADVAGIQIIGLGRGAARATITFTNTAGKCSIGAHSVRVQNIRFVAGLSAVVIGLNVEAAATDFELLDCEFYWGGTTGYDFVQMVNINAGAHRPRIEGNRFLAEPGVAGASTAVQLVGAVHNAIVRRNEFVGDFSLACMSAITTLSQLLMFLSNFVHNTDAGEPYLEVITGTTGVISDTRGLASGATIAANAVADAMAHCENYVVNSTGTIAIVKGAGGSPALDAD